MGPRMRREGKRTENLFDEIMAINFPNLGGKQIFRSKDLRVSQQSEHQTGSQHDISQLKWHKLKIKIELFRWQEKSKESHSRILS